MAPDAKLSFFDVALADSEWLDFTDIDLTGIALTSYAAGARIHSNSWGGGYEYNIFSYEADLITYYLPDLSLIHISEPTRPY